MSVMTSHRIIWYLAFFAAVVAMLVLAARNGTHHGPLVSTMIDQLAQDHPMERASTRDSVGRVAELAASGELTSSEAFYALGLWHMKNGAYDLAESAFRKSIDMRPDWSWPHNALGIVFGNHSLDRVDEAEQQFRTAAMLEPEWSRPYNDLAILMRLAGRFDEAEEHALRALELDPKNVATNNNYGNLLVTQMRLEEAEAAYLRAISVDPEHPKPYYNLACAYALQGKVDDALDLLGKSIALLPALANDAHMDPDFDSIRDDPRFAAIVSQHEDGI